MSYPHSVSEALQGLGYRLTPQRIMILDVVESADDHISAEEIYARVCERYPYVNISFNTYHPDSL